MTDHDLHLLKDNKDISEATYLAIQDRMAIIGALHLGARAYVERHELDPLLFLPGNIWEDLAKPDHFAQWSFDMVNYARVFSPFSGFHLAAWARQEDASRYDSAAAARFYGGVYAGASKGARIAESAEEEFGLSSRVLELGHSQIAQWEELVAGVPKRYRLRLPGCAGEIGVLHDDRIINPDALSYQSRINALYAGGALEGIERRIADEGVADFLEIGSGHCAFAHALNACFDEKLRVHLIDLPASMANGCAYLGCAAGPEAIGIVTGEETAARTERYVMIANYLTPAYERFLPKFDLVHNAISMNEMSAPQVDYYLDLVGSKLADNGSFHMSEGLKILDYHMDALAAAQRKFQRCDILYGEIAGVAVIESPNSFFRKGVAR